MVLARVFGFLRGLIFGYPRLLASEEVEFLERVKANECPSANISDFEFLEYFEGYFCGDRYVATLNDKRYSIIVKAKSELRAEPGRVQQTVNGKKYQYALRNDFVVKLYYSAKNINFVFLVLEHAPCGCLWDLADDDEEILDEDTIQRIVFQVVLGLEYIHLCNLMVRHINPDNIWLFKHGQAKIANLELATIASDKESTPVGLPMFQAPEMVAMNFYNAAVDWWALGITICLFGFNDYPFNATGGDDELRKSILNDPIRGIREIDISDDALDFVERLLDKNPTKRLGSTKDGIRAIKRHPWLNKYNYMTFTHPGREILRLLYRVEGESIPKGSFRGLAPDRRDLQSAEFAEF
ncbi:cAMP-dependent protein kinase, catalytic subunit-like [Galendromus occidentalis]|uniref:cAMP-dependent protein kinase, catalytic subunit-like n=1 Tax=Galendromus occidentalis TaxID=34638 RepID=A0AAJ6VW63_9ACAR|nr:cAMP-dependent protein kinase, catalytic subunit-like [Galendromus occidentalis]